MSTMTHIEKLQQAADAAQQKADAERAKAERAQAESQAAIDARLKDHAQKVVDSFEADEADRRAAIEKARLAFNAAVVQSDSMTEIRDRYLAWTASVHSLYMLYRGLASACGRLGMSTYQDRAIPTLSERLLPATFTDALNAAIQREVNNRSADIEDAWHAEIRAMMNGEV